MNSRSNVYRKSQNGGWDGALEEEDLRKNLNIFPECCTWGRGYFFKKMINFFPECCTRGRRFLKQKTADDTDGIKSSPSVRTELGEGFPECTIIGTRGRPLSRERHP
jgi:hypothetical protein